MEYRKHQSLYLLIKTVINFKDPGIGNFKFMFQEAEIRYLTDGSNTSHNETLY